MIRWLFEQVGFEKMATTKPNIQMDPANIFLARIGSKVSPGKAAQFRERFNAPSISQDETKS